MSGIVLCASLFHILSQTALLSYPSCNTIHLNSTYMNKKTLLFLMLVCAFSLTKAQTVVSFDFASCECAGTFSATPVANVQSPVIFGRGSGVSSNAGGGVFNSKGFTITSQNAAQSGNYWHGFSVSPAAGYQITYRSVSFPQQRSSTGPTTAIIGYSTNGGGAWTFAASQSVPTSIAAYTWDFPDFTTSSSVIFRIWAWGASGASGTYRNDNVVLNGTVAAIPAVTPVVTTTAADNITTASITFQGTVNAGGVSTNVTFNYGTTAALGTNLTGSPAVLSTSVATAVSANATGLSPNTLYYYRASAANSSLSANGSTLQVYTLANTPAAPFVNGSTSSSLNVAIQPNSNPAGTTFAIYESTTGQYVQADGSLGASPVWQTTDAWGSPVTVTGLEESTSYTFQAQAQNGDGVPTPLSSSTTGVTSIGAPLAVRFADVYIKAAGNIYEFGWSNLTEEDVRHYVVERATANGVFETIATIPARLNNGGKVEYNWNDETAGNGLYYYRVKAVEYTGQSFYSDVVRIERQAESRTLVVRPNPVQGNEIRYQVNVTAGRYQVVLYNAAGLQVRAQEQMLAEGSHSLSLPLPAGAAAGVYILELRQADGRAVVRQSLLAGVAR